MNKDNTDNTGVLIVLGAFIFLCILAMASTSIEREKKNADSLEFEYNLERWENYEPEVWRDGGENFTFEREFGK